jgi:hypothetical protein
MKKVLVLIIVLFSGLIACENQENEFSDFDYTTGYFPYQYPVRTLVLGDYIYDNTNDNNHKFLISAAMGGVYSNDKDREFDIEVDESLCNNVLFESTSEPIRLMPEEYYNLSSSEKLTIPSGEFNGNIEVQLTDAFFNDPLSIKLAYVIPIRLLGSADVDSILQGKPSVINPDPRLADQWEIAPKDFTMFAVKYINPYHGKYLHRGESIVKDASNTVLETNVYRTTYIVDNELWDLVTTNMNQVSVEGNIRSSIITGTLKILLTFSEDGNCSVKEAAGSAYTITGTGKFLKDADEWGNKKRDAIHLNYQLSNGTNTYYATDTLVIRDRAVVMELYTSTVLSN